MGRSETIVSAYHNADAFHARFALRESKHIVPEPLAVFYHVACLNNWQAVVDEQLSLCKHVGLNEIHVGILGLPTDVEWFTEKAAELGICVHLDFMDTSLSHFEGPTLRAAWEWAKANQNGAVLYFHVKGTSQPGSAHKRQWRRLMNKHVIADWHMNLRRLCVHDLVGVSWQQLPDFPHFFGNFWMARADWIAHLSDPLVYRHRHPGRQWGGGDWSVRHYAETWIGSEPWHHVASLLGWSTAIWQDTSNAVYAFPASVEGFAYKD